MNTDSGRVAIVMPPRMSTMALMDDAQSKEVCDQTGTLTLTLTIALTLTLTLTRCEPDVDPNPSPNPTPNPTPNPSRR